jgi:16S rRNA (cytidine1402-2'-O)-methyltransferase
MSNKGKLFLIPVVIADNTAEDVIGPHVRKHLPAIQHFLAENIRTARRYLSSLKIYDSIEALSFQVLDKETGAEQLPGLLEPLFQGYDLGVLSESGCPGVADPGALAVRYAHENDVKVVPLVGPSSILLALMASGLNGQNFAFHGYLPVEGKEAGKVIKELEKESRVKNLTQIFIETPYRNNSLLSSLLKNLLPDTQLCLAVNVTGEKELILTRPVKNWRLHPPDLPKEPAVFLFLAFGP